LLSASPEKTPLAGSRRERREAKDHARIAKRNQYPNAISDAPNGRVPRRSWVKAHPADRDVSNL
jgi:hypothetical protein